MKIQYPERESKSLELKSRLPNFHNLVKTCVAFANGLGGRIVIGVADNGEIIGIEEETRNRIYDEFPNSLYDATLPGLLAEIYEKCFDDLSVIIIEIPPSIKKPVFVKSEGSSKGVYLRAGPNTRRANNEHIQDLIRENQRLHFDEEIIQEKIEILSKKNIEQIYKKFNLTQLMSEKIISRSSVNSEKYYPTVAGILMFCEAPHNYIPEAFIQCTRFAGTDGRNIIQTEEIPGSLEKQLEVSFNLVNSWIARDYKLLKTTLKAKKIIPGVALREAIANALIHKKYQVPGSIKIAVYDNRLEIYNPGNFPGLIDLNDLGDGTTYLRNPALARIARRFGIVEKLGTGIRLILESCYKAGIRRPEFIEGADSVKVVFHFLPFDNKTSSDEEKLIALFEMKNEVKVEDAEKNLGVSRNTATRRLNKLIKAGKIRRLGKGPAVVYISLSKLLKPQPRNKFSTTNKPTDPGINRY